jgi:hypothetical protein
MLPAPSDKPVTTIVYKVWLIFLGHETTNGGKQEKTFLL